MWRVSLGSGLGLGAPSRLGQVSQRVQAGIPLWSVPWPERIKIMENWQEGGASLEKPRGSTAPLSEWEVLP